MAAEWRITGQSQGVKLVEGGNLVDVMEVRFETIQEGVGGMIQFDLRNYTPDIVESAIQQRVDTIRAVHAL